MTTTPSNEQLDGLIEQVKAATGPDDKLDYAVDEWLWRSGGKHHGEMDTLPPFTASIDAALALVERLLPGWNYTFNRGHCELRHPKHRAKDVQAFGKTTPLAILAALLSALKDASE